MSRCSFALTSFVFLLLSAPMHSQEPKAPSWQAGMAKVVITPTHPMWMSGYGGRTKPAEGKVHDLWAKALVLQDAGGRRCMLLTTDLVGIDRQLAEEVCAGITKKTGIKRNAIMLSVSHTHCGPVVGGN